MTVESVKIGPSRETARGILMRVRTARKVFVWNENLGRYTQAYKADLIETLKTTFPADSTRLMVYRWEGDWLLFID